jgi:hypothetical protein
MLTVNSLSGGKTSSYIAANYPADIDVFSLVCIDNHNANRNCEFKIDSKLRQMVNDKLQKYCSHFPEFVATAEDPRTLKVMFDLEQHIGREITWLRGVDFYEAIEMKKSLPNRTKRWCTTILKITPIFWFLYLYHQLPVKMRIGYRSDEAHRADTFKESFKFSHQCDLGINDDGILIARKPYKQIFYDWSKGWSTPFMHRWSEIDFRIAEFPLIEDDIDHLDVIDYWSKFNLDFPPDSNCQFCFWKHPNQLRANFEVNSSIMHTAMIMEGIHGNRFHDGISMNAVKQSGLQIDLFDSKFGGCQGGYCTS